MFDKSSKANFTGAVATSLGLLFSSLVAPGCKDKDTPAVPAQRGTSGETKTALQTVNDLAKEVDKLVWESSDIIWNRSKAPAATVAANLKASNEQLFAKCELLANQGVPGIARLIQINQWFQRSQSGARYLDGLELAKYHDNPELYLEPHKTAPLVAQADTLKAVVSEAILKALGEDDLANSISILSRQMSDGLSTDRQFGLNLIAREQFGFRLVSELAVLAPPEGRGTGQSGREIAFEVMICSYKRTPAEDYIRLLHDFNQVSGPKLQERLSSQLIDAAMNVAIRDFLSGKPAGATEFDAPLEAARERVIDTLVRSGVCANREQPIGQLRRQLSAIVSSDPKIETLDRRDVGKQPPGVLQRDKLAREAIKKFLNS